MPDFKFSCPGCGQHMQGDVRYAGKQINCPACKETIIVPQPVRAAPPATQPIRTAVPPPMPPMVPPRPNAPPPGK